MDTRQVQEALGRHGVPLRTGVALAEYSWFRSGGRAGLLVRPESVEQLVATVRELHGAGVPFKVIGETTNLLFLDDRDYGCLVTTTALRGLSVDPGMCRIETETGVSLPELSRVALKHGIAGFAGLEGIPGTVGGAVFMNAGAYGDNIARVLDTVDLILPDGSVETLDAGAMNFEYRNSILKTGAHPGIVARARFKGKPGDQKRLYRRMETAHANRHRAYEYMYPNLGSIFSGSVYRSLGRNDRVFRIAAAMFYFFNYRFRFYRRETPINRKWLNDLALKRFPIKFTNQPFSDKSLNVLVNNGHHTDELLDYIRQLHELIGKDVPIENEIVEPF